MYPLCIIKCHETFTLNRVQGWKKKYFVFKTKYSIKHLTKVGCRDCGINTSHILIIPNTISLVNIGGNVANIGCIEIWAIIYSVISQIVCWYDNTDQCRDGEKVKRKHSWRVVWVEVKGFLCVVKNISLHNGSFNQC